MWQIHTPRLLFPRVTKARAREKFGLPKERSRSRERRVGESQPLIRFAREQEDRFSLGETRLVLHCGDVLTKTRRDAPWTPDLNKGPARGQLALAKEISRDSVRRAEALKAYDALVFAAGTNLAKDSLFSTWTRVSRERGEEPLPLTPDKIRMNVAILRCAGYRAVKSYVFEAKDRHVRAGYPFDSQLQVAVQDAKRVSDRALGPSQRSEEVRPKVWAEMVAMCGCWPEESNASPEAPNAGILTWLVGTLFVLREVELSSLTLDVECVHLNKDKLVVTVALPVSKSDPGGRGAKRSLGCLCSRSGKELCPYHLLQRVVQAQCIRLNIDNRDSIEGKRPLIGKLSSPDEFVEKKDMIKEAQRHAAIADCKGLLNENPGDKLTGHFMRRSGIKEMARNGCAFTSIQWFARHSSQVTWSYIEEAWSETDAHSLKLKDEVELAESVASLLRKVTRLEDAEKIQAEQMKEKLQVDGLWFDDDRARSAIREEARKALLPRYILNVNLQTLHTPCSLVAANVDPRRWTTKCGWPWVNGDCPCILVYEGDTISPGYRRCKKCAENL